MTNRLCGFCEIRQLKLWTVTRVKSLDYPTGILATKSFETRMHSSRMRTGRSLNVCCSLLPGEGGLVWSPGGLVWSPGGGCLVPGGAGLQGGVPGPGGVGSAGGGGWSPGGCLLRGGGAWSWGGGVAALGGVCVPGPGGVRIPACTEADTLPPRGQNS